MPTEEVPMKKTVKVKHIKTAKSNNQNSNGYTLNLCRLRPTNFILGLLIVGITSVVIGFGLGYVTAPKPLPPLYIDVPVPCPSLETIPTPIPKLEEEKATTATPTPTPTPTPTSTPTPTTLPTTESPEYITNKLIESINADKIKKMFKSRSTTAVISFWQGNKPQWVSGEDEVTNAVEDVIIMQPFNAYSETAVEQGSIMYVNYGRDEDFNIIRKKYSRHINKNTIFMARLGKISINEKVKNSQANRGIGLVLYKDVAEHSEVFANAYWNNQSIIAGGTLLSPDHSGDPSTPGYPSIAGAYRIKDTDFGLPTIPVLTINTKDAKHIMSVINGPKVPKPSWKGNLGVRYRIGLGFKFDSWFAKLEVRMRLSNSTIYNVIATIKGSIEPDRYVVIGAHRDAWVFGASDGGSSTTTLLTVSQAFAELVKTGWRPRRTIVFCSWDAELYGQIGSTEFTEQFRTILNDRAISYLNVNSVKGNFTLDARASPLLRDIIFKSAEKVSDPDGLYDNMFDLWNDRLPDVSTGLPKMKSLRADNDANAFANRIGIASLDISYSNKNFEDTPVAHTALDTFNYVNDFIDPSFKLHKTLSEVLCELVRVIADSEIIPFNVTTYANQILENLAILKSSNGEEFFAQGVEINYLEASVANFSRVAQEFQEGITQLEFEASEMPSRIINDQLLALERAMTDRHGLPGRQHITHVINGYSNDGKSTSDGGFPGIIDALAELKTASDVPAVWRTIKHHMTVITHTINSATDTIRNVTSFIF
ncbi:putative N-acetylated-alpha-linked acidic dipeptidase [Anneissia japonica]|uniref:putative N-acetylated-alpha-linked acidic dipeptidase n=1 Tax=Anneissia japonica TaxID=1529436 RepID=UPI001425980A|nr:putative N-acetylated-alpha-linked acidic dipeptidase [Anneissia japonica]